MVKMKGKTGKGGRPAARKTTRGAPKAPPVAEETVSEETEMRFDDPEPEVDEVEELTPGGPREEGEAEEFDR